MNKFTTRFLRKLFFEYFIFSGILVFGLILRFYKINNPVADWHSWRQADTASVTRSFLETKIDLLYPKYHDISSIQTGIFNPKGLRFVEFPIYNAVHALVYKSIPIFSVEIWGRLISVFSTCFSAMFIFLLGKKFIGTTGGLLSSLIYLVIPFNVYFTRVILPEPLAVVFGLASIWFFVDFMRSGKKRKMYLSGVLLALGILVKPFVAFYIVPILYLAVKKFGIKDLLKNTKILILFLIFIDLVFLPFFLWRIWINQHPEGIPHFWWAFNGDGIRFKPSFWRWIFGERIGHLILGSWGLIPLVFGILKRRVSFFNLFFLLGAISYMSVFATANVRHDYYQTFIIPPLSLILAQGVITMYSFGGFNKLFSRILLLFSLAVGLITGAVQVKEFYKINHPEIIEAGIAVDRTVPKGALVIAPYNGDTAFLYQTKRFGWPAVELPVDELINLGARYFVSVNFDDQTREVMERFEVIKKRENFVVVDLSRTKI